MKKIAYYVVPVLLCLIAGLVGVFKRSLSPYGIPCWRNPR